MNIEHLRLVLEHLSGLGAEAKSAFIWWLLMQHVPSFLLWAGVLCLLAFSVRLLFRHLRQRQAGDVAKAEIAVDAIRDWWLRGTSSGAASSVELHKLYCEAKRIAKAAGHRVGD